MNEYVLLVIGILLIFGTGIFVASEFALVNLDRHELEARRDRGEKGLDSAIAALRHTATHLSSAQLGITLTTLLSGYTLEPAISSLIAPLLRGLGLGDDALRPVGAVIAMALATLGSMILGELVPKNFALSAPIVTAKLIARFQIVFTTVFKPLVAVLNGSANAILRLFGIEPKEELSGARGAEELASLVRRSAEQGTLDTDQAVLLQRAIRFSDHVAGDVMTPRPRITSIEGDATVADVVRLSYETGHSRFPVIDDGVDDIKGVVHLKQAIAVPAERRSHVPAGAIMEEILRVPESLGLDALLGDIRGSGYQIAVVEDEYGGTAGVVTLEDLVEEIVGELVDEHDRRRSDIIRMRDGAVIDASLRPDELLERTGIEVPEDEAYETLAGFVVRELGRVPEKGDSVATPQGTFTVERMDRRRIDRLRYRPTDHDGLDTVEAFRRVRAAQELEDARRATRTQIDPVTAEAEAALMPDDPLRELRDGADRRTGVPGSRSGALEHRREAEGP